MDAVGRNTKAGRVRLRSRHVLAFVLLVVGMWLAFVAVDLVRRQQASEHLLAAITSTPSGGVVDVAAAYDIPWDRAVVVGPYWNGDAANSALGFDHFPPDAFLTAGDGASLLLMVQGRTVLSEIEIGTVDAAFEEGVEQFGPGASRFRVVRENDWATLVQE